MRDVLQRILAGRAKSAQDIVNHFARKGIARDEITGEHLSHVYRRLKILPGAPNFSQIAEILPKHAPRFPAANSAIVGVIIETRRHPKLEPLVSSFSRALNIPIRLFHGTENLDWLMSGSIATLVKNGHVNLVQLEAGSLDASRYNALLLIPAFWDLIGTQNKILVFQTDTVLCSGSEYTLSDFLSFDYIGSKWQRRRPIGIRADGGNGGLSLRDWRKSYECLSRFPPQRWTGGEDGYFAFHLDIMGGRIGRDGDCAKFSTQYEYLAKSFGAHDISWLDRESRKEFIKYCPEAAFMLTD